MRFVSFSWGNGPSRSPAGSSTAAPARRRRIIPLLHLKNECYLRIRIKRVCYPEKICSERLMQVSSVGVGINLSNIGSASVAKLKNTLSEGEGRAGWRRRLVVVPVNLVSVFTAAVSPDHRLSKKQNKTPTPPPVLFIHDGLGRPSPSWCSLTLTLEVWRFSVLCRCQTLLSLLTSSGLYLSSVLREKLPL